MSLSRKDYEAIAAVLDEAYSSTATREWNGAVGYIVDRLVDVFERDNANFNRERFIAATKEHDHG